FAVLYSFTATNSSTNLDGAHPVGGLISSGSTSYGTASAGGTSGYGTIFSLLMPSPLSIAQLGTNVVLTWPTNAAGFGPHKTTSFGSTWTNVSGQYSVTNPASAARTFYRLLH